MNLNEKKNFEFESLLRSKMDEMASSVDCFDKISRRAFPDVSPECSDHEIIVSDLENITGKKHHFRFTPILALAAAVAVFCLVILPKNNFKELYSSLNPSGKDVFCDLINEIEKETSKNTYDHYDFTLDEYIKYDRLISPLYRCPFEAKDKENINVRLYVRTYNNIQTNQIYAIEYEGNYSSGNFIAAADSSAKFTDEELSQLSVYYQDDMLYRSTPSFSAFGKNENALTDKNDNPVATAQFNYGFIGKSAEGVGNYFANIMYCQNIDNKDNENFLYDCKILAVTDETYDILVKHDYTDENKNNKIEFVDNALFLDHWNNSLYYSGEPAMDDKKSSGFINTKLIADQNVSSNFYSIDVDITDLDNSSIQKLSVISDVEENCFDIYAPLNSSCFSISLPEINSSYTVVDEKNQVYLELDYQPYASEKAIFNITTGGKNYSYLDDNTFKNIYSFSDITQNDSDVDVFKAEIEEGMAKQAAIEQEKLIQSQEELERETALKMQNETIDNQ